MLIASSSLVASAWVAAFCSQDFTLQQYRMTIVLLFRRYRTTLLRQFEKLSGSICPNHADVCECCANVERCLPRFLLIETALEPTGKKASGSLIWP